MTGRKLLLALVAVTLLLITAAPVMAETRDPFDPDALAEKYLKQELKKDRSLSLNASIDDYYYVDLEQNGDGNETYTLTMSCKSTNVISPYSYCYEWYKQWKDKITRVIIENGDMNATEIGPYAFYNSGSLISVTMPSTIKSIDKGAFFNCFCLNEIDVSRVTYVGVSAFFNSGPNPQKFNFRTSVLSEPLIFSYAMYDTLRPGVDETTTSSLIQYMDAYDKMVEILSEMDLDGKSDIEKTKKIYEWITTNVTYDHEALDYKDAPEPENRRYGYAGTMHSALFEHRAICHGYAILLRAMLNESGVDCLYVSGPTTEGFHAWNLIKIDGNWYLADSTWDAGYTDDPFGIATKKFFLRSSSFFYDDPESGHLWPDVTDIYRSVYQTSATDYYRSFKSGDFRYMYIDGSAVLLKYTGKATTLTLPQTVELDGVSIPVTTIGAGAFDQKDRLRKVVIPEGYIYIAEGAFNVCWSLTDIVLPSTLEKIGRNAFEQLSLYNVTYRGTAEQFLAIDIEPDNNELCSNTIHCSDGDFDDPRDINKAVIRLSQKTYVYDGESHTPDITVTMKDGTVLEESRDYMLRSLYYDTLRPARKVNFH